MSENLTRISFIPRVVTGEKNSPTAAHVGRKRRQNGYRVPGGIAGTPCPGGYKYGGLALQVGGWATGRQTVAVRKLLGNLNYALRTVNLSGIDLGSGKGLMS